MRGPGADACHDEVEVGLGTAVDAAVQPSGPGPPGGLLDRADTARSGEGGPAGQPLGVIAGGNQQGIALGERGVTRLRRWLRVVGTVESPGQSREGFEPLDLLITSVQAWCERI